MATLLKLFAVAFIATAVSAAVVAAETHHIAAGPDFDAVAWLSDRLFTVGDKLRLENLGSDGERMVEVQGLEEFESCDVSNPIRMVGEAVDLAEEGIRYFTSSNAESCRNGVKLPIAVNRRHDYDPDVPSPYRPDIPTPPYDPYEPDVPYPPHEPDVPYPPHKPDVYPPPAPSSSAVAAASFALSAAASFCYLAI